MSTTNSTESMSAALTSPSTANMTTTTATTTAYHNLAAATTTAVTSGSGNNSNNSNNDYNDNYAIAAAARDDDNRQDSYKSNDDNQSYAHTFNTHDLPITPNMVNDYKAIIGGYDLSDPKLNAYDDDFDGGGPQRQDSDVPELPPAETFKNEDERRRQMLDYASDASSRSSYATIVEKYNYKTHGTTTVAREEEEGNDDVSELLEKLEMGEPSGDVEMGNGVSAAVEVDDERREETHVDDTPKYNDLNDDNHAPIAPDDDKRTTTVTIDPISKPTTNPPPSSPPRRYCTIYRLILLFVLLLLLVVVAGVTTAVTIARSSPSVTDDTPTDDEENDDVVLMSPSPTTSPHPSLAPTISSWSGEPTPSPSLPPPVSRPNTPRPSSSPSTAADKIRAAEILLLLSQTTDVTVLTDPSTPQHAASRWLTSVDPLALPSTAEFRLVQRYVLAVLYYATNGDSWKLCGAAEGEVRCGADGEYFRWLSGVEECRWYGVMCDGGIFGERGVRSLILRNNRLRGHLPPELSSLSQLQILSLSHNALTTTSSSSSILTSLPSTLLTLELNNNDLHGPLPSPLAARLPHLTRLSLGNNKFTGTVPSDLFFSDDVVETTMSNLTHLDLERNGLWGTIPSALFHRGGNLVQVDFSANEFGGTIDARWGGGGDALSLPSLRELLLHDNLFSGTLPSALFRSRIMQLSLGSNRLWGTIPDGLFLGDDDESTLEYLHLGDNDFDGTLSTRFGELRKLKNLILWKNRLSGTIPREMGGMVSLELLQLQYNRLTGTVPMEICAATPEPLAMLGVDCLSPGSPTEESSSTIPPKVECDCCTCFVGYE